MTQRKTKPAAKPATPLPPDVTAADLKWPKGPDWEDKAAYKKWHEAMAAIPGHAEHHGMLTFYHVPAGRKAPEWVLTTLRIGGAGKRGTTERFYGIGVADSKLYTVGRGPHVTAVVTVHVHPGNVDRLGKYAELWLKGMADAGGCRDRLSSRRMQGQMHRAAGRSSWYW